MDIYSKFDVIVSLNIPHFFALSNTWGILLFGCLLIVLLCVELGC